MTSSRRSFLGFLAVAPVAVPAAVKAAPEFVSSSFSDALDTGFYRVSTGSGSFADIVTTTLQNHSDEILENITTNNALLRRLQRGQ